MTGGKETKGTISGFTPLFDAVVQDVGLTGASVFGRVWRYCQGKRNVCFASRERMARETGLSRKSFDRWLRKLCDAGYLEDLTPTVRYCTHTYRDTGKVRIVMKTEAVTTDRLDLESNQVRLRVQPGQTESPTGLDLESHKERSKKEEERQETPVVDDSDIILSLLYKQGIYDPVAGELTQLSHVTVSYVKRWCEDFDHHNDVLVHRNKHTKSWGLGFLVTQLRQGVPPRERRLG